MCINTYVIKLHLLQHKQYTAYQQHSVYQFLGRDGASTFHLHISFPIPNLIKAR